MCIWAMTLSDFYFSGTPLNCELTATTDSHHLDPVCVKNMFSIEGLTNST